MATASAPWSKACQGNGMTLKQLWTLFPNGPADSACKWAGVPKPTGVCKNRFETGDLRLGIERMPRNFQSQISNQV